VQLGSITSWESEDLSEKQDFERSISTATLSTKLQSIIDNHIRRDNYLLYGVVGYSFAQRGSAFTIGGKIPKIPFLNNPEIPLGLIYVQENYVNSLPMGELEFAVLHELGHLVNNHVIWNIVLLLTKENLVDWLKDALGTSKKNVRDLIGIVKLVLGGRTIEEELTAQKELAADAFAVTHQGTNYHGVSLLHRFSDGNVELPTHITQDGSFFNAAITFGQRIHAMESL
jgi:Zn-dependent protease with chaperone function